MSKEGELGLMPSREEKLAAYASKLAREDPILTRVRRDSDNHREAHGCDVHPSDAVTGRMLDVHVRAIGAKRVLEVGCGLGYSTIWLARALPRGGRVDTMERDPTMRNWPVRTSNQRMSMTRSEY